MNLRPNRIKHKLAEGGTACIVSGLTHPDDIDAFGGGVDAADLGNLTRACDIWGLTSVVRVNRNDQALIYRTLDRGAQGIVVPHVNTKAEAQNVVDGGKFAPIGKRGMFTSRQGYGVPDVKNIVFARPVKSAILYKQMKGRRTGLGAWRRTSTCTTPTSGGAESVLRQS